MTPVIHVSGLRKEYRGLRGNTTTALADLDLEISGPGVVGLLGPNGSGKTTTIRCLLGLVRPTAGTINVLGVDISDLGSVVSRIGALVEGPKFSPTMSGRTNLELFATMSGVPHARVHEVLELVELTSRADDPVSAYSLGMGQRLGIAAAMLGDPELVILDEPTNGLDPAGIADVRRLVRRLADEGRTVLISSHQLHEVQQICDRVIILSNGSTIASGTVDEIIGANASQRIVVTIDDRELAAQILGDSGFNAMPSLTSDELVVQIENGTDPSAINRILAHEGLFARFITADKVSLEDAFLTLTASAPSTTISVEQTPSTPAGRKGVRRIKDNT